MTNSYRLGTVHSNYLTPSELQTEFRDYKLKVLNGEIDFNPTLKEKYKDDPFLNPYRTKNMYNMQTTGQIMLDLDKKEIVIRMDNEMSEFVGIKNKLPKGYTPKLKVRIENEKTHNKGKKLPT